MHMSSVFKNYFSHSTVIGFILMAVFGVFYIFNTGLINEYLIWIFIPILLAPFYEWYVHKYQLHVELTKKDGWYRRYQIVLHHGHHRDPDNIKLQFAPWRYLIYTYGQVYLFYSLIFWSFGAAMVPFTGHLIYHLWYEWIHLAHHSKNYKPLTKIGKSLRDAHMSHHFHNENYNWGITNMIGDYFFKTLKDNKSITKSPTTKSINGYTD
jgi:hypothetical protein